MGRKKMEIMGDPASSADMRGVNLKLSKPYHRLLRRVAAELDVSMTHYAASALIKQIEADSARLGIRDS
jgi:hypothetical protein